MPTRRPSLLPLTAAGVAVLAGGCGGSDATAPHPTPAQLSIRVTTLRGPIVEEQGEDTRVSCGFDLDARATGTGEVGWYDAVLRFQIGSGVNSRSDSVTVRAAEVARAFGGALRSGSSAQATNWAVSADAPFVAVLDFGYQTTGESAPQHAEARLGCGPSLEADASPPAVTALSVAPGAGSLPADSLPVTFTVVSATGVWRTGVSVSGPCEAAFISAAEHFEKSITRTVLVPLAPSCALGAPVTITAVALDAVGRQGVRSLPTGRSLADDAPPRVSRVEVGSGAAGGYAHGDTVRVEVTVTDNHALRWLVWEAVGGSYRDSLPVSGQSAAHSLRLRVGPEWGSGPVQLRFVARDVLGLTSAPVLLPAPITVRTAGLRPAVGEAAAVGST